MHKRPQPVKLWYLSSFFRYERAQSGPLSSVLAGGGRGARLRGSGGRRGVDRAARRRCWRRWGSREVRLRLSSLGSSDSRERYRERLQAHLRANAESLSAEVRERIELNPLRAFDSTHEGTVAVDARRAATARRARRRGCRALCHGARAARSGRGWPMRSMRRWCGASTTTRARCSSSRATPLARRAASAVVGATTGWCEQLGGPATPGMGWAAGIERILLAGSPPRQVAKPGSVCGACQMWGRRVRAHESRRLPLRC